MYLEVTLVGVFHDDVEHFCFFIIECLFVLDNEWGFDGGQEADLVERILFIFFF